MSFRPARNVFLLVLVIGVLFVAHRSLYASVTEMQGEPTITETARAQASDKSDEMFSIPTIRAVGAAFLVGVLGAAAFIVGVYTGFISRDARAKILEYVSQPKGSQIVLFGKLVVFFIGFGGVVAGVFQWAQTSTFAPIQAFVLGATWPSVVTRVMAGDSPGPPPQRPPSPEPTAPDDEAEVAFGAPAPPTE